MKVNVKGGVFATAALVLTLAGCAEQPTQVSEPAAQPAAPVDAVASVAPVGGNRIYIYRRSIMGAAVQPKVYVDGAEVGRCSRGNVVSVAVSPGTHTISATTETRKSVSVSVSDGQDVYVKCRISAGIAVGRPKFIVVPVAEGAADVAKMKR